MCGIVGYRSNKPDIEKLIMLINHSKIRGIHAFGMSYYSNTGELCVQKFYEIEKLLKNLEIQAPYIDWNSGFIFHSRYSTSGDWAKQTNNMPIIDNGIALVLNGVISMLPKPDYERLYGITCKTENDAEIILKLIEKDRLKEIECTKASIAALWLKNRTLFAFRNNKRPLYQAEGFIFSTYDIGKRSGLKNIKPVEAGKIHDC